jgi:hypothetical protein
MLFVTFDMPKVSGQARRSSLAIGAHGPPLRGLKTTPGGVLGTWLVPQRQRPAGRYRVVMAC